MADLGTIRGFFSRSRVIANSQAWDSGVCAGLLCFIGVSGRFIGCLQHCHSRQRLSDHLQSLDKAHLQALPVSKDLNTEAVALLGSTLPLVWDPFQSSLKP